MGLRRSDLGLLVMALAAAGLIVAFLAMTDGGSDDESASTTTAVALRPGRVMRYPSPQVPELAWSSARGAFSIRCRQGQLTRLDARITSLPADHRYAWRVITGDANETVPLSQRPAVRADLVEGDGLPSAFTPTAGTATVRFTFEDGQAPESLGLNVVGVDPLSAFVIATPQTTCPG
jgi:hypothetical protein